MDSTYILLQHYWWFLVSLLGALLVFLLFVQGGQSLLFTIGKTELQQKMLLNSTGRKWEFTFTTLVTFGGAFFASFPLFYSTSFGGAYWVWILILLCFVLQAVSYEYQAKKGNLLGKKTYRIFLIINGVLAPVLLGAAVGTFFNGANFFVNKGNITDLAMPVISTWGTFPIGSPDGVQLHGLEAALNIWNLLLGLAVFFLSRVLALLYFINNIADDEIQKRSRKQLIIETGLFLVFFLAFVAHLLLQSGFAVNPDTKEVYMEPYKYLINLIQMPAVLAIFLLGVVGVLFGIIKTIISGSWNKGIWFAGTGTVFTVLALFLIAGWNNTAYYPSLADLQSSLTIENSSSSIFTLKTMSYVSILIPFVLAYIIYAWRALDLHKIDSKEMKENEHTY
jgi:cytochrome d ubiquinol oxidase subunit II